MSKKSSKAQARAQSAPGSSKAGKPAAAPRRRKLPNWPLLAPALLGMALSGYLTYGAWFGAKPLFCGAGSSCDVVQSSRWAEFMGTPLAFWGFLTYAALAVIAWRVRRPDWHWQLAWLVALTGMGVSVYLTVVSLTVLQAACMYCLGSLAIVSACVAVLAFQGQPAIAGFSWPVWLAQTGGLTAAIVLGLHLQFSGVFSPAAGPEDPYLRDLAIHVSQSGAQFYGASWCPHCQRQKELFGAAAKRLPYVECSPGGQSAPQNPICEAQGVDSYPTWIIAGRRMIQVIEPPELARLTGFAPPPGAVEKR
jgi:uncharacterized membrane protein